MNNKGLIITLIVILVIIIIGLIAFLCLALNGKIGMFSWFMKKSTNIVFEETYDIDLNNLEILSSAGDVNIKESTDGTIKVVVYGQNADELKVSLKDNNLKIDYSEYKNNIFGFNNYINDIIVYIPNNYSKEINIDVNYGKVDITNLENANVNIKSDCGDVVLGKVNNISLKSSLGDIKIDTILNKCDIKSNCGDIKIDSIQIKENSQMKSDLGDIKIREVNDIYIDAKTDLGEVKVNNNNRHAEITLKLENDCGDIKVED